jgi:flagellar secretion chaperone FliS
MPRPVDNPFDTSSTEHRMRGYHNALNSYGAVQLDTGVAMADNVRLIQMLFDGLLDSMVVAKGHMQHGNLVGKNHSLSRASRILLGLQSALDFEHGGELAQNLNELYLYVNRRLVQANAQNDVAIIDEAHGLISEIREAWSTLPSALGRAPAQQRLAVVN